MNRLAHAPSPYLQQHAHNPVDWWPWCSEAIDEARRRNVPIFLSIGYSTCYWCHVMERESFENQAIAQQMNQQCVNIKLDREERPDLDDLYMTATQLLTGHGGWPMSVFLEPRSLRPFFAGTYFPPEPRSGMPSFPMLMQRMSDAYAKRPDEVRKQADAVAEAVAERLQQRQAKPVALSSKHVGQAIQTLLTIFDRGDLSAGFGRAPKFPQPVYLDLLLACRGNLSDASHVSAVDTALRGTLDAMAIGGIYDHLGGGFHRYAVDSTWTVPHFEKMLYDNALLIGSYAQGAVAFDDAFYRRVAIGIFEYVQREMTSPLGCFYTAQDAEVDHREGLSYLWHKHELETVLSKDEASFAIEQFGLDRGPNFQDPHHPQDKPASVLRLAARPDRLANRLGISTEAYLEKLDAIAAKLLAVRNTRKQPRLDDKTIVSWNGLMIAGLAKAGGLLEHAGMIAAAKRGMLGLQQAFGDAWLHKRVTRGGVHSADMLLEDFAAIALAAAMLGKVLPVAEREVYIAMAKDAIERAITAFSSNPLTADELLMLADARETAELFIQPRSTYDGAVPSASSVMLEAMLLTYELTADDRLLTQAGRLMASLSHAVDESPIATANATRSLLMLLTKYPNFFAAQQEVLGASHKPSRSQQEAEALEAVQVLADATELEIGRDHPAEVNLQLRIAEGYHINDAFAANDSGGTLIPLSIAIVGGTGLQPYAEFPRGVRVDGAAHGVHTGQVDITVAIEKTGAWAGPEGSEANHKLVIRCQPCSEVACLQPIELVLDIAFVNLDAD
jgi:uncharacterized protein